MAFENYKPAKGYWGSKFVGFDQFRFLFEDIEFWRSMRNTLAMSVMNLIFSFLFAIVFALLLNEIKSLPLKKITQTVSYLPLFELDYCAFFDFQDAFYKRWCSQ